MKDVGISSIAVMLMACGVILSGCASESAVETSLTATAPVEPREADTRSDIEEKWGIEILGVRATARGFMLDFRYRVLDPVKALPLLDRSAPRHVIDQRSGVKMPVPTSGKTGPMRQSSRTAEPGRVYFVIFTNPGQLVKPGDRVTVVVGDFRAENLVVR